MQKLEAKCMETQDCMYNSIQDDFDSISDYDDNDPTPLQRQQDEREI